MTSSFQMAELLRKMANLFNYCEVIAVSGDDLRVSVEIDGESEAASDFIPVITSSNDFEPLKIGDKVMVVVPDGEWSAAFVMGVIKRRSDVPGGAASTKYIKEFSDGARFDYDTQSKKMNLKLPEGSKLDLNVSGDVSVNAKNISLAETPPALGVVTGECVCAFTGAPHPQASTIVKAGLSFPTAEEGEG